MEEDEHSQKSNRKSSDPDPAIERFHRLLRDPSTFATQMLRRNRTYRSVSMTSCSAVMGIIKLP